MKKNLIVYPVLFICLGCVYYYLNLQYSYQDFSSYSQVLLSVSSMVFTIMGLWIAFLYPNALQRLVNSSVEPTDFSDSLNETKRLESLVGSIIRSAIVVVMVMLIYLAKILFFQTEFFMNNASNIKAIMLAVVTFLSILQIESIVYVIKSNVLFLNDLHGKREKREGDNDY